MSILEHVRQALESDPRIVVIATDRNTYFPDKSTIWADFVTFVVAPLEPKDSIYELNSFIQTLVPGVSYGWDPFRWSADDGCVKFGRLSLEEIVGTYTVTTSHALVLMVDDFTLPDTDENQDRLLDYAHTLEMKRRVVVHLYPSLAYAERSRQGIDVHSASVYPLPAPIKII